MFLSHSKLQSYMRGYTGKGSPTVFAVTSVVTCSSATKVEVKHSPGLVHDVKLVQTALGKGFNVKACCMSKKR